MKIDIEERVLHFKQPAGTSRGVYTERRIWLVSISDGRTIGRGECAPLLDLSCDAMEPAVYNKVLRRFCDQVEQTGEIPYEEMRDYPSMLFGLETAMMDVRSKKADRKGILFDTPFARGEQGITINGLVWMGNHEEMLQRMEEKLKLGFRCVKLKVGAIDFDQELDLVKRIRERFSYHEVELRLDANGGFRPDEALYKLELLSQYAIHSIEQPIKQKQWAMMAELCRESPLPIATTDKRPNNCLSLPAPRPWNLSTRNSPAGSRKSKARFRRSWKTTSNSLKTTSACRSNSFRTALTEHKTF